MDGSEPYMRDMGLLPFGERDSSLHLYRRNSCHQERLNKDLQRLRQQEQRALRKATREIIDLNLEQKEREEILNKPRRRSVCLGFNRHRKSEITSNFGERLSPNRLLPSRPTSHDNNNKHRRHSSPMATQKPNRSRSSSLTSGAISLPPLDNPPTPTTSRLSDRPQSKSFDPIPSPPNAPELAHELFMDAKSRKDFTRLKKVSDRWRKATNHTVVERSGKPLIPTNAFGASTATGNDQAKTTEVFRRLSIDARTSTMPSEQFLKLLRSKNKAIESSSPNKSL